MAKSINPLNGLEVLEITAGFRIKNVYVTNELAPGTLLVNESGNERSAL